MNLLTGDVDGDRCALRVADDAAAPGSQRAAVDGTARSRSACAPRACRVAASGRARRRSVEVVEELGSESYLYCTVRRPRRRPGRRPHRGSQQRRRSGDRDQPRARARRRPTCSTPPPAHDSRATDHDSAVSELRIDPYIGTAVHVVEARQARPNLPSTGCPFCVGGLEAPDPYDVRWFPNRWPAMGGDRCEVVLYTPEHDATFWSLGVDGVRKVDRPVGRPHDRARWPRRRRLTSSSSRTAGRRSGRRSPIRTARSTPTTTFPTDRRGGSPPAGSRKPTPAIVPSSTDGRLGGLGAMGAGLSRRAADRADRAGARPADARRCRARRAGAPARRRARTARPAVRAAVRT